MKTLRIRTLKTWFLVLVIFALSSCVAKQTSSWKIVGESMEPNFSADQIVQVEPVELSDLRRGDVILYEYDVDRLFLKRLVGLPGDTVEIRDGRIILNSEIYDEPYEASTPRYTQPPLKLGENEYYVLGDNRNNSSDSHSWGALSGDKIKGRLVP